MDWDQLNFDIMNDPRNQLAGTSQDANIICDAIIDNIRDNINKQVPSKHIQVQNKIPEFISADTKDIIR